MMAASSRMMRVTSWRASHTSSRKVLGGRGGIVFEPNTSLRRSMSDLSPLMPGKEGRGQFPGFQRCVSAKAIVA